MLIASISQASLLSRPVRGEWIEILLMSVISPTSDVSPRAGRVD